MMRGRARRGRRGRARQPDLPARRATAAARPGGAPRASTAPHSPSSRSPRRRSGSARKAQATRAQRSSRSSAARPARSRPALMPPPAHRCAARGPWPPRHGPAPRVRRGQQPTTRPAAPGRSRAGSAALGRGSGRARRSWSAARRNGRAAARDPGTSPLVVQPRVGPPVALAPRGPTRPGAATAALGSPGRVAERGAVHRRHVHLQVDPVEQRPRQPPGVATGSPSACTCSRAPCRRSGRTGRGWPRAPAGTGPG